MKEVEGRLEPINGYLQSIKRNALKGWYELEVAIPANWAFSDNNEIGIEIISELEMGKVLRIYPKNPTKIVVDDLILFSQIIINTNIKIAEKEVEFKSQLEEMKKGIEKRAKDFFSELDELKVNSFKKLNDNFVNELTTQKKTRKKRTPKPSSGETATTTTTTTTVSE